MFKKKWFKRSVIILGVLVGIYLVMFVVNIFCNISLRKYIQTFEPVAYGSDRIVPGHDGKYVTFTTDEELEIMFITDMHIGGGFWSYKQDKKSIYEVITMLQVEQPDIVILGGDNTYCVPAIGFNGGNTFNNIETAKTVIEIFEHEQVYFSTVFGNHDTESFDYANRQQLADLYMDDKYEYCFFEEDFTDKDAKTVPSVSNQIVVVKLSDGTIKKLLLLIDTNAYESTSLISSILGKYDVIHEAQIEWAASAIEELSNEAGLPEGEYLESICFMHIPIGEYRTAYDDLFIEEKDADGNIVKYTPNPNPKDTVFLDGVWDEKICYGGLKNTDVKPEDQDMFFEKLAMEMRSVKQIFCGHDHINSAHVDYKRVGLDYGYSIDNIAYGPEIAKSGTQRGADVITLIFNDPRFEWTIAHKNAYVNYKCDYKKFYEMFFDKPLRPEDFRTIENYRTYKK